MKLFKYAIVVAVFCQSTILLGQGELEDTEFWSGFAAKAKVNKKLKIELEEQIRFNDTISNLKSSFTELSFRYNLGHAFKLKGSYRHTVRYGEWQRNRNRISVFLYYKWKKKNFPVAAQFRLGVQNDKVVYNSQFISYARGRIKLESELTKRLTPFISYESFYRMYVVTEFRTTSNTGGDFKAEFRTNRYTAGLAYKIDKRFALSAFYRREIEINVKNPETQTIGGLMLTYNFKI